MEIGLTHTSTLTVENKHLAIQAGSGDLGSPGHARHDGLNGECGHASRKRGFGRGHDNRREDISVPLTSNLRLWVRPLRPRPY